MKIRLTERQHNMLKNLNEGIVDILPIIKRMEALGHEVDKINNLITATPIGDFLSGEIKTKAYSVRLDEIDDSLSKYYNLGYAELERIPDDEYRRVGKDYDMELDDVKSSVNKKIMLVGGIITHIDKMVDESPEWVNLFNNKNIKI
jgi:hypothetical protein